MEFKSTSDRTKLNHARAERRRETVKTVRGARERLMSSSGTTPAFDSEILQSFARTRVSASTALLLLTICVGVTLSFFIHESYIIIWALAVLVTQILMLLVCRRFLSLNVQDAELPQWRRRFVFYDLIYGLYWGIAPFLPFIAGTSENEIAAGVVLYAVLLIALASATTVSYLIPSAIFVATMPLAISSILFFVLSGHDQIFYIMAAATGVAEVFFLLVSQRLYHVSLSMMGFRAEKDAIFAELEQQKAISDDARRTAEDANLAKSRFLATMSHELRTPLNAILGFSEVMKDEILGPLENPSYKEYATDIHNSGRHLLELINEILDLSRIEAGRYKLNEEAVSLLHVAEDCHHLIKLRAKSKDILIHEAFEEELPKLWADERALRQITLNLLSNAVKFTPQGGQVTITVGWTAGGGQYLSVRDSGPGIAEDEIPIVLAAFGQGSIARKNAEAGTGLGLPIVQALTALHGGQFNLSSKLREGTEVTVAFPRSRNMEALGQITDEKRAANAVRGSAA